MEQAKNMLKEVDMQIVYRRLDARKKDITRDGKIPKQRLANAYRGYYGLEEQYNSLIHKSNEAYFRTKAQNNIIQQKHNVDMNQILAAENVAKQQTNRTIQAMREDFHSMLAYQYVYKEHSFKRYDNGGRPRPHSAIQRPVSGSLNLYDIGCKPTSINLAPRRLGSVRDSDTSKDDTPLKLPPINNGSRNADDQSQTTVNLLGETWYDDGEYRSLSRSSFVGEDGKITSFPSIQTALGVEIKVRYKANADDDESFISAPPKLSHGAYEFTNEAEKPVSDMGQSLLLMKQKQQENQEKRRLLPTLPGQKDDSTKESYRRLLPKPPTRPHSMLPHGARTAIGVRKFMKSEVKEILDNWDKNILRMEELEKAKQIDAVRPKLNIKPNMSTAEILNDFKKYKEDLHLIREQKETDHPIIIRQMSPQPKPASPISRRISEYSSRIPTPQPRKDGKDRPQSPAPESETREKAKSKRKLPPHLRPSTFQELTEKQKRFINKIPSVSRTASYQEIPELPGDLHENALLTAAERIEKERQKMYGNQEMDKIVVVESDEEQEQVDAAGPQEKKYKVKRKLPVPPAANQTGAENQAKPKVKKQEKYFDTSDMGPNSDLYSIHKVEAANNPRRRLDKGDTRVTRKPPAAPNMANNKKWKLNLSPTKESLKSKPSERKSNLKSTNGQGKDIMFPGKTETPGPTRPNYESMKFISSFSGKPVSQQVARRMHSNYDSYSRNYAQDMRQHLDVMAKRKRKQQLENAKLIHARYTEPFPCKDTASVADSEPSSKVSFNETVTVYHDRRTM